jgi:hypothetical protein
LSASCCSHVDVLSGLSEGDRVVSSVSLLAAVPLVNTVFLWIFAFTAGRVAAKVVGGS